MAAGTLLISCDATRTRKRRRGDGEPNVLHPCLNESEIGDQAQIEKHKIKTEARPVDLPHDRGQLRITEITTAAQEG